MILLERPELAMVTSIAETVLNVGLCAAGLHFNGLFGAALGMLLGTAMACVGAFTFCFLRLHLPAPSPWTAIRIVLACLFMGFGVRVAPHASSALSLAFAVAAGLIIYAAAIVLLFPEIRTTLLHRLRSHTEAPAQ